MSGTANRYEFDLDEEGPGFEVELTPHEFELTLWAYKGLRKRLEGTRTWRQKVNLPHDDIDDRLVIVHKLMSDFHDLRRGST